MANQPSLSALRVFEAAARHLSFTLAARELHVTQGAVSHQIRALEADLGYPLFTRLPRQVLLTQEGQLLSRAVGEALGTIEQALARNRRRQGRGWITVSASPSFAMRWLVPRLDDFRSVYPDLDVRIAATDRLVDPRREAIDLCIRYGEGHYPGLSVTPLSTDEVFPVCSPRLAGLESPADLRHHRLLHDEMFKDHPQRPGWEQWASLAGLDLSGIPTARFSHASMAIEAAIAGQGVALGRSCLVDRDLAEGRLTCPFGPRFRSPFSYWLITPPGGQPLPRVQTLMVWLESALSGPA